MFFAKPGEYKPCGLFSLQHIILLFITIVLIIIALKLTKTNKKENIRKIIISVTIFCWIMEIIKIVFNLKIGNVHNVNTYIPLYYCSILLYAGILSSFRKGKVKRTTANRRHLLANKTKRQKLSSRRPGAYADKTCENTIKKLLPYGN